MLTNTILHENGYGPDEVEHKLAHEDANKMRSAYSRAKYLVERKIMVQNYGGLLDNVIN